jgi:protoporphyrinogen oxidase
VSTVVVGGGLAGLSATLTLQEAGEEVELFEASDNIGGRVRSDFIDGFILDRGFQLINSRYPEIKRLGVLGEIDFQVADRSIDVITPFGLTSIGDPRKHPLKAFNSPLGSLKEKLGVLKFLTERPNSAISLRDALLASGTGDFYHNLLAPFLRGVFLTELENIDSAYGREIIKSLGRGQSGLPAAGVGTLSDAIAARIENIELNRKVESLSEFDGRKVIIATDASTSAKLLGNTASVGFTSSFTWYHALPAGRIKSKNLRITSAVSPIVNSIAISNVVEGYAPAGNTLISSSSISNLSDEQVLDEISKFWGVERDSFELIKRYEIKNSLPIFAPGVGVATTAHVRGDIYCAGDYMTAGSQNGALLSGRLAALESLTR